MYRFLLTRRWVGFLVLCIVVALACVRLGFWQLSRYQMRSADNARVDRNAAAPAVPAAALLRVGASVPGPDQWRRVQAVGRYEPSATMLVRQRPLNGSNGFEVLTPLVTTSGVVLVVDRGWVPSGASALSTPTVPDPPAGLVAVTGLVRASETGQLRSQDLPSGQVRHINVAQIAEGIGRAAYGDYVQLVAQQPVDTQQPAGAQKPVLLPLDDSQPAMLNLAYTVQWWVFAVIALVGYVVFARREAAERAQARVPLNGHRQVEQAPAG